MEMRQRPVHEVRYGRVRAAVWQNETQRGPLHSVTVTRAYRLGDQWRDSSSFSRDDIPLVIKALDEAHTWMYVNAPRGTGEEEGTWAGLEAASESA